MEKIRKSIKNFWIRISWDKKRLAIEVIVALFTCFMGIQYGESKNEITYNGDVITYEIYADTIESIETINEIAGGNSTGEEIAEYALQFEGNPYVYGGTSLTNGADASGFVSSVYNNFGFALPHSSAAVKNIGQEVDIHELQLGDVVCYENHVGIYVGDSKIIHASNPSLGIVVSDIDYREAQFARRIAE